MLLAYLKTKWKPETPNYTSDIFHISNMLSDYNTTSDGWLEWNGAQYYIQRSAMAMEEARRACQEWHSDLVTVSSEAESVFLWKRVTSDIYTTFLKLIMNN